MEQVQQGTSETKRASRPGWIYLAVIVAFLIIAGVAAYLTYTNVRDFVAVWNMTDLPGIVVDPEAGPATGISHWPGTGTLGWRQPG